MTQNANAKYTHMWTCIEWLFANVVRIKVKMVLIWCGKSAYTNRIECVYAIIGCHSISIVTKRDIYKANKKKQYSLQSYAMYINPVHVTTTTTTYLHWYMIAWIKWYDFMEITAIDRKTFSPVKLRKITVVVQMDKTMDGFQVHSVVSAVVIISSKTKTMTIHRLTIFTLW